MQHQAGAQRPADWYSVLGLDASATTDQISAAVERLARQANALSLTAPERARQLRDQVRAIKQDLLSGTEPRQRYDQQLAMYSSHGPATGGLPVTSDPPAGDVPVTRGLPATGGLPVSGGQRVTHDVPPRPQGSRPPGLMSRVTQFLQAGWTCANCGYGALPNDKFCPKCGGRIQSGMGGHAGDNRADVAQAAVSPTAGQAPEPASCRACGNAIAPGDVFCTKCGKPRA